MHVRRTIGGAPSARIECVTTLLTGASGFLGVHTLAALLDAGERVRAYVRTPSKLDAALSPLGLSEDDRIEVVSGDMTDEEAVTGAVAGCDFVVHAAATFSYKRRDAERMRRDNAAGARAVLHAARDAGVHAVHVSSTVALARPGGTVLDGSSPLGPGFGPYSDSKVASEKIARDLQAGGAPVSIVNPGGILGPDDPYLGESDATITAILTGRLPSWPRGRLQWVDVRDLAAVLVALREHPSGGRWLVPGHDVTTPHEALRDVTGRRLPCAVVPAWFARALSVPGYLTGWSFVPGQVEGVTVIGCGNTVDASATTRELGVTGRPLAESLVDTVRWLVDAGHVSAKQAGKAAH
jgi:dihydroflavonol-4-reductase